MAEDARPSAVFDPDDGSAPAIEPGIIGNRQQRLAASEFDFDDHHAADKVGSPPGGKRRRGAEKMVYIVWMQSSGSCALRIFGIQSSIVFPIAACAVAISTSPCGSTSNARHLDSSVL